MTYFIDTDVMIDFFKHKDPAKSLITSLSKQNTLALSALTVAELRSGWTKEQAEWHLPRLYALCSIVPVSREIAEQAGQWRQEYKEKGLQLGTPDTVIAATHVSRAPLTNNAVVRSQSVAGKQKLVQVTFWVDPAVKEHLERRARQEGLSLSPAGAAFLRKAVQQDIDLQYSALLRPIIETTIAKQMAGMATRLTWLLVRIAFDAGQTRSLVTNILGRQKGVSDHVLKTLMDSSCRSAKANIMRRNSPDIRAHILSRTVDASER